MIKKNRVARHLKYHVKKVTPQFERMQRLEGFYHKEYNIMNWVEQSKELWGELHWKSTLAHMIGVNKSTVRRWGTGQYPMRQVVADKVDATYKIWKDSQIKH